MQKRQLDDDSLESGDQKKFKYESALVALPATASSLVKYNTGAGPERLSSLMAPEVSLTGHEGAVLALSFDSTGKFMCSGSYDRRILLWDIANGCENFNVLTGHKNAVLQVSWKSDTNIISCSADKTVAMWDANKGIRTRKFADHTAIVNSCAHSKNAPYFASASDDCTVVLWDERSKQPASTIYHDYQLCSVAISEDGNYVFSGGVDNVIRRFDTRMTGDQAQEPDLILEGHSDTVTGLDVSPDGNKLLSNAMDSNLRVWDIRAFVAGQGRCESVLTGVHHGAEKLLLRCTWSPDQKYITCGSADRLVHMWETDNFSELGAYPGHKASVNQVCFHPDASEPIIASASSDKSIILGEYSF